MKKFCNCNSKWEYNPDINMLPDHKNRWFQQVNFIAGDYTALCRKCMKWPWYDVHYENMMFDLKNMNRC